MGTIGGCNLKGISVTSPLIRYCPGFQKLPYIIKAAIQGITYTYIYVYIYIYINRRPIFIIRPNCILGPNLILGPKLVLRANPILGPTAFLFIATFAQSVGALVRTL